MKRSIALVALVVPDYDAAIAYFVGTLGFSLLEDTPITRDKRWVRVAPPGATETALLLAKAATPEQHAAIGAQAGGRVFLFLRTDDFGRDFERLSAAGVEFLESPRVEPYGRVAVFRDAFGNRWDLIEERAAR